MVVECLGYNLISWAKHQHQATPSTTTITKKTERRHSIRQICNMLFNLLFFLLLLLLFKNNHSFALFLSRIYTHTIIQYPSSVYSLQTLTSPRQPALALFILASSRSSLFRAFPPIFQPPKASFQFFACIFPSPDSYFYNNAKCRRKITTTTRSWNRMRCFISTHYNTTYIYMHIVYIYVSGDILFI